MYSKKQSWNVDEVVRQVHAIARECQSPYTDGFTGFELKKDLYQLKEIIDSALSNSPTFHGEKEWLTEQEQKRIIKILKS